MSADEKPSWLGLLLSGPVSDHTAAWRLLRSGILEVPDPNERVKGIPLIGWLAKASSPNAWLSSGGLYGQPPVALQPTGVLPLSAAQPWPAVPALPPEDPTGKGPAGQMKRNVALFAWLLSRGADPWQPWGVTETEATDGFDIALRWGDASLVAACLRHPSCPPRETLFMRSPWRSVGSNEMVSQDLKGLLPPTASLIQASALAGHAEVIQCLLAEGWPLVFDPVTRHPLALASTVPTVQVLLAAGLKMEEAVFRGKTVTEQWHLVASQADGYHKKTLVDRIQYMYELGQNGVAPAPTGLSPLQEMTLSAVKAFVASPPDLDGLDRILRVVQPPARIDGLDNTAQDLQERESQAWEKLPPAPLRSGKMSRLGSVPVAIHLAHRFLGSATRESLGRRVLGVLLDLPAPSVTGALSQTYPLLTKEGLGFVIFSLVTSRATPRFKQIQSAFSSRLKLDRMLCLSEEALTRHMQEVFEVDRFFSDFATPTVSKNVAEGVGKCWTQWVPALFKLEKQAPGALLRVLDPVCAALDRQGLGLPSDVIFRLKEVLPQVSLEEHIRWVGIVLRRSETESQLSAVEVLRSRLASTPSPWSEGIRLAASTLELDIQSHQVSRQGRPQKESFLADWRAMLLSEKLAVENGEMARSRPRL